MRGGAGGRPGHSGPRSDASGSDSSDAGSNYSGRGGGRRWADQEEEDDKATSFGEGSVFSEDPLEEDRPAFADEGVTYDVRPGFQGKAREKLAAVAEARAARGGGRIPQREMPDVGNAVLVQASPGRPKARLAHRVHLDLRTGPGTFLTLQECTHELEDALQEPSVEGQRGHPDPLLSKKQYEFWTFRSDNDPLSAVVAARKTHVKEAILVTASKRWDGKYKDAGARGSEAGRGGGYRDCFTKYVVARFVFHEDMTLCGKSHLTVMSVHLHGKTAQKAPGFSAAFDEIWPELSGVIQQEAVDIVSGNWGASLFQVIPRLREEGVFLQLGAWFPWERHGGGEVLVDTCGVFFWGSHQAPKRVYQTLWDCMKPAAEGSEPVQAAVAADSDWDEEEARDQVTPASRYPRLQHFFQGQGHPVGWFLPGRKRTLAEMQAYVEHSMEEQWGPEESRVGTMPPSREKPLTWTIWDSTGELFRKGSHMPLACFLGWKNKTRRSAPGQAARDSRDQHFQGLAAGGRGGGGGGGGWNSGGGGWNSGGGGWGQGGRGGGGWGQGGQGDCGGRGGGARGWNDGGGGWNRGGWNSGPGADRPSGAAAGAAGSAASGSRDVPAANLWANWGGVNQPPAPPAPSERRGRASGKGTGRGGGSRSQSRSSSVSSTGSWWGARRDLDLPVRPGSTMTRREYLEGL